MTTDPQENLAGAIGRAEKTVRNGEQGKFWEMSDARVTYAADLSPASTFKYAQGDPLEMISFGDCMDGKK
ncbi:MAG: hypothetical protein ACYDA9_20625 [Terriglobia bacterium]